MQAFLDVSLQKLGRSEKFLNENLKLKLEEGQNSPAKLDQKSMMAIGKLKHPSKDELDEMMRNLTLNKNKHSLAGM